MELPLKHCAPCEEGMPPFTEEEIKKYSGEVQNWKVVDSKMLLREFKFKDFRGSIDFVRKVADVAEAEGHHPDIYIFYNVVRLEIWTHSIGGLSQNDFILAAKINNLAQEHEP